MERRKYNSFVHKERRIQNINYGWIKYLSKNVSNLVNNQTPNQINSKLNKQFGSTNF